MQYILLFLNLCEDKEKCKDAKREKVRKMLKRREKEKLNIENFLGTRLFKIDQETVLFNISPLSNLH